jgi:hypothetical protein
MGEKKKLGDGLRYESSCRTELPGDAVDILLVPGSTVDLVGEV